MKISLPVSAILLTGFLLSGCGSSTDSPTGFQFNPAPALPNAQLNPAPGPAARSLEVRKSATTLTSAEKQQFAAALHRMKAMESQFAPKINAYDYFVELHVQAFASHTGAHMAPGFLPWHRELLRRFEAELRRASGDPEMTVPYWDWTDPESLQRIFAEDFLGGDGDPDAQYQVTNGPFRAGTWRLAVLTDDTDNEFDFDQDIQFHGHGLQRKFGEGYLPTLDEVRSALDVPRSYDAPPYNRSADINLSFRNFLEGWRSGQSALHNGVHVWVGGQMQTASSPNDPAFFLHHCNVDRIWSLWQARYGNDTYPRDYHHGVDETLFQFGGIRAQDTFDLEKHSRVEYAAPRQ
jgi:tyrosinase